MKLLKEAHKKWPFLDPIINMVIGGAVGACFSELVHDFRNGITPLVTDPVIILLLICIIIAFIYNKYWGVSAATDIVSVSMKQHVSHIIENGDTVGAIKMKEIINELDLPTMREVMSNNSEVTNQELKPTYGTFE